MYSVRQVYIFFFQKSMPMIGIEPTTYGLQNRCSTVEPHRQVNNYIIFVESAMSRVQQIFSLMLLVYYIFMRLIDFEINTGEKNMQIDNDLLDFAIGNKLNEPVFRLYGWSPACVSLGRNQKDDFLDKEFLKSKNIDLVRRLTGGRALLHDKEITYSYVCSVSSLKKGESIVESYKEISQILIDSFEKMGISLEFGQKKTNTKFDYCMSLSTGADLCYEGKKLIGSAQFRKEGYILQHGSILLDYDKKLFEEIFKEKIDENSLTCLKQIDSDMSIEDVYTFLRNIKN